MHTRIMVGAFLTYKERVLLIHRGMHKKLAPGMWSCIGGHMEPSELNNPLETCYREIEEETGISREFVDNLQLRYITIRNVDDEIRTGYYFIGNMEHEHDLIKCDEGDLYWININHIPELPMTFSVKQITTHWINNPRTKSITLCSINKDNDKVVWSEL